MLRNSVGMETPICQFTPEWSDGDTSLYAVAEDRGDASNPTPFDRIAITPLHWDYAKQGVIRPVEVVQRLMLRFL